MNKIIFRDCSRYLASTSRRPRSLRLSRRLLISNETGSTQFNRGCTTGSDDKDAWIKTHSAEKEEARKSTKSADEEAEIRDKILDAALQHVIAHGWTRLTIACGAEELGYVSVVSGLFPNEGLDLVLHHVRKSNRELDTWLAEEVNKFRAENKKIPVGKLIRLAVEKRLRMNIPYMQSERWTEAMAMLASPQNATESIPCIQEVCDDIWHRVGDQSADMNWYSKRISLAAIFGTTEVFMLQDKSEDFKDTWSFLDRRFEDLQSIPQLGSLPGDLCGLVSGLSITARNIAGMQK